MTIDVESGPENANMPAVIRNAILEILPDAEVDISQGGEGHFTIRVVSEAFQGLGRVKQQQLVYGAIAYLMSGATPPIHAVDRLECETP